MTECEVAHKEDPKILLVVESQLQSSGARPSDRKGGKEEGIVQSAQALIVKAVDAEAFAESLSDSISQAAAIMQKTFTKKLGGYAIDEITISLAVTGEGNIGIATAGVEASVEVKLKRLQEEAGISSPKHSP